jgi:hypothetical protein
VWRAKLHSSNKTVARLPALVVVGLTFDASAVLSAPVLFVAGVCCSGDFTKTTEFDTRQYGNFTILQTEYLKKNWL